MREKGKGRLIPPFWRLRELKMTFSNAREGRYGTYSCTHPHALRRQRARIGISTNAGSTMLKPSLKPFQTKVQDNSPGSLWTKTVAVALHFFNILPFQRDPRRQFVGAFKLKAVVGHEGGEEGFHNFTISSLVSKRLFLATLGSMTFSTGDKILPNVFLSSGTAKCVGPQLVLNPKGS